MALFCDNTTVIEIVKHAQTKHIELDKNYIKDNLDSGIKVLHIKCVNQLANIMIHSITGDSFHTPLSKLNMRDIYV